ncbi:hypothetical protein [Clostridium novyi]
MKIKKIFKRDIALKLIARGHKLIYTEPNRNIHIFSVFCFEETGELLRDLTELTQHN